ncbi:MAG: SoxR reducing system RseC family protein [bacterium]
MQKEREGEWGVVTAVFAGKAKVRLERKSLCEKCGICSVWGKDFMLMEVDNLKEARVGDKVRIETPPGKTLKISFMVFIVPLFGLFVGIFSGYLISEWLGLRSLWQAGLGVAFFLLGFLGVRWYDKKTQKGEGFRPRIVQIEREEQDFG